MSVAWMCWFCFFAAVDHHLLGSSGGSPSGPPGVHASYDEAYYAAMKSDRPLLVLVSARWCPPCQEVKRTLLPRLARQGHLTIVEYEKQFALAQEIAAGHAIPLLVVYRRQGKQLIATEVIVGKTKIQEWLVQKETGRPVESILQHKDWESRVLISTDPAFEWRCNSNGCVRVRRR